MILPGMGGYTAHAKSAPEIRGSVQSDFFDINDLNSSSCDIAAHQAGDVIVVLIAATHPDFTPAFNVSSGWTDEVSPSTATTRLKIISRIASGSSHTLDITNTADGDGAIEYAVHSYAIRFAYGSVSHDWVTGSRNPPSLSPGWGSETNLWIAANLTLGTVPATQPSGFGNAVQTSNGAKISTADLSVDSPTLDPGAFEGSAGASDISLTIAVRPA